MKIPARGQNKNIVFLFVLFWRFFIFVFGVIVQAPLFPTLSSRCDFQFSILHALRRPTLPHSIIASQPHFFEFCWSELVHTLGGRLCQLASVMRLKVETISPFNKRVSWRFLHVVKKHVLCFSLSVAFSWLSSATTYRAHDSPTLPSRFDFQCWITFWFNCVILLVLRCPTFCLAALHPHKLTASLR